MALFPRVAALALLVALAACATDPTQPDSSAGPVALAQGGPHTGLDDFVAAQGTWCDAALPPEEPGNCDNLDELGIGWITAFYDLTAPIGVLDPAGVNARWYAAHREPGWPEVPPFSVDGIVNEKLLKDGRRSLQVSLHAENAFVAFYDLDGTVLLGADFFEFGTETPVVAQIDFDYEAVLPAGYVGYPDLVSPEAWEGVTRIDATFRMSGVLRGDLRGVSAGTEVDVVWRMREFPRGDGRSGKPNLGFRLQLKEVAGTLTVSKR